MEAIEKQKIEGLIELALMNPLAVSKAINESGNSEFLDYLDREAEKGNLNVGKLYYLLKNKLGQTLLSIFKKLAVKSIIKGTYRVTKPGRGKIKGTSPYKPGKTDFNMEATLDNVLGKEIITYEDILGIEKKRKRKGGVIILDVSGSMQGDKIINAALIASVAAHQLRKDDYSFMMFSEDVKVMKRAGERRKVDKLILDVLNVHPIGYTDISKALEEGFKQLQKIRSKNKWAILITDGMYNRGGNPAVMAKKFGNLNVIGVPGQQWGKIVCRMLAQVGNGKYIEVKRYSEIPRVIKKLMI